ncbi:MAG: hypothetical protein Q8K04_01435 [Lutibacter sp.]|nr:hypothetical protein [Lutibacter sp.]
MKPQLNNYAIAFMLFFSISGYCQKTDSEQTLVDRTSITTFDLRSKELVGSIYINEAFLPAKLSYSQDQYLIRYNAYQDEMEIEKNGNPYHLSKNLSYSIYFEGINKTYQVYNYLNNKETVPGFFVVLFNGDNISLLIKEKIKFYDEVKAKNGYDKYKPPTLKRVADEFYIGYKNKSAKEFPNKKKDILALFASKAEEIGTYMNANKLGFKNQEDLLQIFRYYDTLK